MKNECIPCFSQGIKTALKDIVDPEYHQMIEQVPTCPAGHVLNLCPVNLTAAGAKSTRGNKEKSTRPRSAYQEFISQCLQTKPIKGKPFGEAAKYLKECAIEWRGRKSKNSQGAS